MAEQGMIGSNSHVIREPSSEELLASLLQHFMGGDSMKMAEALLTRFDNFAGVVSAPVRELMKVSELPREAAEFLSTVPLMFRRYMDDMNSSKLRVYSTEIAYKLIRNKFFGRKTEIIVLLILNSRGHVVYNNIIAEGSIAMVPVYIKDVVRLCVEYNADTVILAHNHPSGNPVPSKGDVMATKEVQLALESIYVTLHDHLIFTDTDYYSMRNSDWLRNISRDTEALRKTVLSDPQFPMPEPGNDNKTAE